MAVKPGSPIKTENIAKSDVSLPRRERRKSSIQRHQKVQALKDLPHLKDTSMQKREVLFQQKLQLCSVIFNFDDPSADKRGKDLKRQTLLELVDYINNAGGQKIFTESLMPDILNMVSTNICRSLPPQTEDFDPEEDEPVLEASWPHLQVVYEFFLRFVVSSEVNAKVAKKYVDQKLCMQLVELFDSEDPRERDYLKTILHRIYGKFMSHRAFIRKSISNVFYRFVFETERHNGVGELLEILGSIINGFALPLKKEHLQFLIRALVPLHKPKCVSLYHQQLSYCITQYVEKDPATAIPIIQGIARHWPWVCSSKQVLFLNELEEILELMGNEQVESIHGPLFRIIALCVGSQHFQVAERTLFLWNNEHLVNNGCLSRAHASLILPAIYAPLFEKSKGHWNATVEGLAQNVLKLYMEYDMALYDKCTNEYTTKEAKQVASISAGKENWKKIEHMAAKKMQEKQPKNKNMSLQCSTCGNVVEANFSENEIGQLVCDLCGTQSQLQNRQETQEMEEMGGAAINASRRITKKRRLTKKEIISIKKVSLLDCLLACQSILQAMVDGLIKHDIAPVQVNEEVKKLWMLVLSAWSQTGKRSMFNVFYDPVRHDETLTDPPKALGDALSRFTLEHLLGILYLACRKCSTGILPSDIAHHVLQGKVPYFGAFYLLHEQDRFVLRPVQQFFTKLWQPNASSIAVAANYLQIHVPISLPVLNIHMAAYRITRAFQMPPQVYHNYLRLLGAAQPNIGPLSDSKVFPACAAGIVAYLVVSIKLIPSWHFWVHENIQHTSSIPWHKLATPLPLSTLQQYTTFLKNAVLPQKQVPSYMTAHLDYLDSVAVLNPPSQRPKYQFHHKKVNTQAGYFYPVYVPFTSTNMHAATAALIGALSKYIDIHPSIVFRDVAFLDRAMETIAAQV